MDHFGLKILRVENGYLVMEDDPSRAHYMTKSWVAEDVSKLTALIGKLATGLGAPEVKP